MKLLQLLWISFFLIILTTLTFSQVEMQGESVHTYNITNDTAYIQGIVHDSLYSSDREVLYVPGNYATIQAAVTAFNPMKHSEISLADSTYTITSVISITNKDYLTLEGNNAEINVTGNIEMIVATNSSYLSLKNMRFKGTSAIIIPKYALKMTDCPNLKVDNIDIDSCYIGISIKEESSHSVIKNCEVTNYAEDGYEIDGNGEDLEFVAVENCYARPTTGASADAGFEIEDGCKNIFIKNCRWESSQLSCGIGFQVQSHVNWTEITITRNIYFINCIGLANYNSLSHIFRIGQESTFYPDSIEIRNVYLIDCIGRETDTTLTRANMVEVDNDVRYVYIDGGNYDGRITVDGANNVFISPNTAREVYVENSASNVLIKDIIFDRQNQARAQIYVYAGCDSVTVDNCTFANFPAYTNCVIFAEADHGVIKDCEFRHIAGEGVRLLGSDSCVVMNNYFEDHTGSSGIPVRVLGDYALVSGNIMKYFYQGIYIDDVADYTTVSNNTTYDDVANHIYIEARTDSALYIMNNTMINGKIAGAYTTQSIHRGNYSSVYATYNTGNDSIVSGQTTKTVTHGIDFTPTGANISINFTATLGAAVTWWLSSIGSSAFTVNVDGDPGANIYFTWAIKEEY